jgi:hypothetical protein
LSADRISPKLKETRSGLTSQIVKDQNRSPQAWPAVERRPHVWGKAMIAVGARLSTVPKVFSRNFRSPVATGPAALAAVSRRRVGNDRRSGRFQCSFVSIYTTPATGRLLGSPAGFPIRRIGNDCSVGWGRGILRAWDRVVGKFSMGLAQPDSSP